MLRWLIVLLGLLPAGSGPHTARAPNVVLVIADDLNTRVGPYGADVYTPNLDRLAAAGTTFLRAYAQYPVCGPSRASILSGMYPESNGVMTNGFARANHRLATPGLADHPSLPGLFREAGYYTARVSKVFHMGVPGGIERGEAGPDDPEAWDFAVNLTAPETMSPGRLETLSRGLQYGANFSRIVLPEGSEGTQADVLATDQAIAILQTRTGAIPPGAAHRVRVKPDAPFFLAVGLVRPHVPLIAPERHFERYPDSLVSLVDVPAGDLDDVPAAAQQFANANRFRMTEEEQRKSVAAYHASISFMDEQLGRLLDALEASGQADNTIVVFVSDHGFNLGEHTSWQKLSLWEDAVRVPLLIAGPGVPGGDRREGIVELVDLYPTLARMAGLMVPPAVQGRDLAPLLGGEAWEADAYTVTSGGASLRTDRYRYSRWGEESEEELYDHLADPGEFTNLASDPASGDLLEDMRARFDARRAAAREAGRTYGLDYPR